MVANDKLVAAALKRLDALSRRDCFDPVSPTSRPTAAQQEVMDEFGKVPVQWIVAATQSGKSQTCSRVVTWFGTETHPTWSRPVTWGDEPLLILVCGRTGKQIEESLLPKIESYLERGSYKVVRIGNIVQRLEFSNGNRIVFQSLENPNVARERIQSYVAHLVWVDEMPPTAAIIDELLRRIQARSGFFLASFTPLVVNDQIRKMVDSAELPYAKKYKFTMFDNPLYASEEKRGEILSSLMTLPESVRNTRLYGDWSLNDDSVYYFDYDQMVEFPEGYSPLWRHVEAVDPALKSALGYTLWAENPANGYWYCVLAQYIRGIYVPTELVKKVKEITGDRNVIRRVADPHEVWYIQTAASMGINYVGVHRKSERKDELIKQFQQKLSTVLRLSPTCEDLISELQECRWSSRSEGKIVNSSSYHLCDSAQYFCDNIPPPQRKIESKSWEDWLYQANKKRIEKREAEARKQERLQIRRSSRSRWRQH